MDIINLEVQLELLQTLGFTLSIDEKLRLKMAHIEVMNSNESLDELKFWGKIQGIQRNYYILLGLRYHKCYEFPHKTFFWASNDFQFKELPELLLQHKGLTEKFNSYLFTGDANKVLVNIEAEGEAQDGQPPVEEVNQAGENKLVLKVEEEDDDVKKEPKNNFTQLHRLSTIVKAIQNEAHCVPKGSYKMTPEHQLHPNLHFYGLKQSLALAPQSWQHFRFPQSVEAKCNIEQDMVIFSKDFLDNIEKDSPRGCWSTQIDAKGTTVTLRSLLWPGYYSFHRLESAIFGSVYLGDGVKNIDLPFMI